MNEKIRFLAQSMRCRESFKFTKVLLVLLFMASAIQARPDDKPETFTLKFTNTAIIDVLKNIEKNSDYVFLYSSSLKSALQEKVSLNVKNASIRELMNRVLGGTALRYRIDQRQITITRTEHAQPTQQHPTLKVTGVVTDENGETLIGVSIQEVGTNNIVVTDADGHFTMYNIASASSVLKFTYVGFKEAQVRIGQNRNLTVKMESDVHSLDETVVVGYGTQKKADLTGAVSSVDVNKALSSRPIADVGRGLQGSVPGLNIRVASGEIGSDPLIHIRGQVGSVNGSSSPLILLDNVEIPSLQLVNPDDIESISVLKDAASASIYGAKAAFGVILITTKKGSRSDKFEVNYSNNFAWQTKARDIDMAGYNGLQYTVDAQINRGNPMPAGGFWRVSTESLEKIKQWQETWGDKVAWNDPLAYGRDYYFDGVNKYGYRIYDGVKAMIRDWAPYQTHNLSVNGKSGKTTYNVGVGILSQDGMLKTAKHDDFKRYNASLSLTSEINKYLSVRASSIYSNRNKRYPGIGNVSADPWLYLYRFSRLMPMGVTENGNVLREPSAEIAQVNADNLENKYYNVSLGFTLNFTKNWDLKFDYTYDRQENSTNSSNIQFTGGQTWYSPSALTENGQQVYVDEITGERVDEGGIPAYMFPMQSYYNSSGDQVSWVRYYNYHSDRNTFNVYSTYNWHFGPQQANAFKFMAGMNRVTLKWRSHTARRNGLITQSNPQFDLATGDQFADGSQNWESQLGFFGRINYAYRDKYLAEVNLRRDGSSKFPKDLRWKWFPSFSAGWVFTGENFMKSLDPWLSFGKVRISWGTIGDQTVSNTLYNSVLSSGQTAWIDGTGNKTSYFSTPTLVDNDITWQTISTLNIGADLRFFNNDLGITLEWYKRKTNDMIIAGESLPVTLGTRAPSGNYGNLETKGWEVGIDYNHRFANGLAVNAMFSIGHAITDITKGADWATPWEDRSINTTFSTGRRYGDIYGYVTDRLFQKGDFVYDADGNLIKTTVIYKGVSRTTNKQNTDYPVYQVLFEDNNKLMFAPGDVKFVDLNGDGYIDNGSSTNGDHGDLQVIGNSTPRYEYSIRLGASYKGFDITVFGQGIGKRKIWGSGQLAIPGYNAKEGAMPEAIASDYWREDRTDAFYPRAWDLGGSNSGFGMQVQSKYLLNMAYFRIKNINLGYSFPEKWLKHIYMTKARLYVSMENFFTFDHLRDLPIDPEAVSGYSMFSSSYNLSRTGTGTPVFKSLSFGMQITF